MAPTPYQPSKPTRSRNQSELILEKAKRRLHSLEK